MTPASKLKRFVAALIDGVLSFLFYWVPFLGWVLGLGYHLLKDGLRIPVLNNRSVGKHVMGLKVVTVSTNERQEMIDWTDSLRRNILMAVPFVGIIEAILVLVNQDGRRLGDRVAKSIVVEA